ncbi:hypothetical protein CIB84_014861 [Bambusicola thoracicus]|uniref:Uncharacterized protein n=1 Tax=Bambusicola thoracicus TaxID=9083 RepID=A0A2P4SBA2_BAMTH|nr:hypothetical protein CIB84_014861 [Bambusicola thoracicus]
MNVPLLLAKMSSIV